MKMTNRVNKLTDNVCKRILSIEMKITSENIKHFENNIRKIRSFLFKIVRPEFVYEYETSLVSLIFSMKSEKETLKNSQNSILSISLSNCLSTNKWFKILLHVNIPKDISDLISLGPKFALPAAKTELKLKKFLVDAENIIEDLSDYFRDSTRANVTNVIANFIHNWATINSRENVKQN